ncbi:ACT domain-containing protein [Acidipropionibacterium jensenii]|uniref:glycine cleavage system protein R n=1 Tax=Acidipropionibacterium jensenii TaxID=1749 RepID=UPI00110B3CC1|nr:ACT domain-containing protein [Acidipropionibacterium jensenii]QCV87136.1 ACT domain-containing protein [Acidipropionibacterium jensenii]
MAQLLLTAVGEDRPGIVSSVAAEVAQHGGNWLESRMALLAGAFAGIVLVDIPDDRVDELRTGLAGLAGEGLDVTVTPTRPIVHPDQTILSVRLIGHDRPGIVSQVTGALAGLGATIDDLDTGVRDAPMGDGVLFEASAKVRLTTATTVDDLRAALEAIASELMVDIDMVEAD